MSWKSSFLIIAILITGCREEKTPSVPVTETRLVEERYANPYSLIEVSELVRISGQEGLKIIDFRPRPGFEKGHITGALPIWRTDIEDKNKNIKGMIAPRKHMEDLLSGLGISPEDTLVVYDDQGGLDAARFWWVMQVYGFEQVRILNGGLNSWKQQQLPLSTEYTTPMPKDFRLEGPGDSFMRIERDSVLALLGSTGMTLIDTRTSDEYSGKRQKQGAQMAGRIPGSMSIDWAHSIWYNGDKTFRSVKELKKIYGRLPGDRDSLIITYCHSGVRSAHTSFVLTQLLGYKQVLNYDGSWLEWSSHNGSPAEKDSITSILN